MARPSTYTEAIAEQVLEWIAQGKTLRSFCRRKGTPGWRTVYDWRDAYPEFAKRLQAAREVGYDAIAEDALAIADRPKKGITIETGPDGTKEIRKDMLGHRKLQVWTRLQLLAKWSRRYGERTEHTINGPVHLELKGSDVEG